MMIDYNDLAIANKYYNQGLKDTEVVFDVFFKKNPFDGGYTISGGLDNIIDYINNFYFSKEYIEHLRTTGKFSEGFLNYLKDLKFNGDIYAVKDGTVVFPNEPVITVKANIIEAQLLEKAILNHFNYGSLITTKAKRITKAAKDIPVMEFGQNTNYSHKENKYSVVGGCVSTSNIKTEKEDNLNLLETIDHSEAKFFGKRKAFYEYAINNRDNCIFSVNAYHDSYSGTLKRETEDAILWVSANILKPQNIELKGIKVNCFEQVEELKRRAIRFNL